MHTTLQAAASMVHENALQVFGSVNEINPSCPAVLTLTLKPGEYLFY